MPTIPNSVIDIQLNFFVREAVRSLSRNKLRSALSAIGITIGVAAVVCVVAIGTAGSQRAEPAIAQINALLRERHHILPAEQDDFNIRHPEEVIKAQIAANHTLAFFLISVASLALLVGGIGIMNVMLVSVTERTTEIGLRLAIGATTWAIQIQFLGEAVMLSLFGGLMGVFVGAAGSFILGYALGWPVSIPLEALIVAPLFAIGVGIFFGFYPAWRATQLDPITTLRRE